MARTEDAAPVHHAGAVRRMRWVGVVFAVVQLGVAYRPPPGAELPVPRVAAILVVCGWLTLLNVASWWAEERGTPRVARAVDYLTLLGDIAMLVALIALFTYDPSARLWPLLVMTTVEGAFIGRTRGAVFAALVGSVGASLVDLFALDYSAARMVTGTTYHTAIFLAVAASSGHLAGALDRARRTAERQSRRLAELADREAANADRLRALDARRDEVFHLLAHELRKPLTVMTGAAALLRDGWGRIEEGKRRELLDRLHARSVQMARLVADLEDVSAADQGTLVVKRETVDLRFLVTGVVDEEVARSGAHRAELDLPAEGPYVVADEGRLTQVVRELVTNALKYSPDGGAVAVSAHGEGDRVVLLVRDDGPGIPPHLRDRVFDKYERAPQAHGMPGTGLGLYLTRMLVEAMGGDVRVTGGVSGTTLRVELPAATTAAAAPALV